MANSWARRELLAAAAGCGALAVVGPARAAAEADLYAKAKAEGALTMYPGGPTARWEATVKRFEARYPGIKVSLTGGFSNVLEGKLNDQIKAGVMEADMTMLQTVQSFFAWKKRGVLMPFKPASWNKLLPGIKDPDGQFVAINLIGQPYAYNSQKLDLQTVPKSALDFLKPELKGKIVSAYPQDDDATMYVFDGITRKYGWEYWDRYMANEPRFIQGHMGVARSVSSGESWATLDTIDLISLAEKAAGQPHEIYYSTIDPVPIWAGAAAIFKGAPHPNAAKLFLSWYLEKDEQALTGSWSVRNDMPTPKGLKPLSELKTDNTYWAFLSDDTRLKDLRVRYEKIVGPLPAKNTGAVR